MPLAIQTVFFVVLIFGIACFKYKKSAKPLMSFHQRLNFFLKEEIMNTENTNWNYSVAAVVIRDKKVLLARHTYGKGKGKLIIPGGYVEKGETPQAAVIREFSEETNIAIEPQQIIGIRFNMHDWYVVFSADYISGNAKSDNDENSEVIWLDIKEALQRNDVPDLTKNLIRCALNGNGMNQMDYKGTFEPCSLYGIE